MIFVACFLLGGSCGAIVTALASANSRSEARDQGWNDGHNAATESMSHRLEWPDDE